MLDKIFNSGNDNYDKARAGLNNVKKKFDGFVISFPDVTTDEIIFIKEKWESLPKKVANGVKIMALDSSDTIKSFITQYNPNAYIIPHRHLIEYEVGTVIQGSITNKLTGVVYTIGDTYTFPPNEIHYMASSKDGCLVYSALTTNKVYKLPKVTKKILKSLKLA
jgi:quercetin dioxygenase-like cupin family protein